MSEKTISASSIARMAGNIAAGIVTCPSVGLNPDNLSRVAETSVKLARLIVAEIEASPLPAKET